MNKHSVVYTRVSTDSQDEASQLSAIDRWLETNPQDNIKRLHDTKSGKNMARPGIKHVIRLIEAGRVSKLIFWRLSRLGRNVSDILKFLNICVENNVELIALAEKIDLGSAFGRAMVTIMAVFDQLQREIISENTKEGIAAYIDAHKNDPNFRFGGAVYKEWFSQKTRDLAPAVMELHKQGLGHVKINKRLGLSKKTILKIIKLNGIIPQNKIRDAG